MAGFSAQAEVYDLLAVGCGPFNLGLSALASTIPDLRFIALEETAELRWHPGILFDDATLQVSFLADLVTLVAPTHPLSFLAYLRDVDRMYPFYVRERFHLTRREYELYLRWAAAKLPAVRFSHRVERVTWEAGQRCFRVEVSAAAGARHVLQARHLALGVGTEAHILPCLAQLPVQRRMHSGEYLTRSDAVARSARVTVVGSGQSGAEVVLDLLRLGPACPRLSWLTRTESFAPLDYTKLVLEMTTPAYVHYFHRLSESRREQLVTEQFRHYKGISTETLEEIHDQLYRRELLPRAEAITLRCGVEVQEAKVIEQEIRLTCRQRDTGAVFAHECDLVIAATGYRHRPAAFLAPIEPLLRRDSGQRLRVCLNHAVETDAALEGRIFIANADLYSHGVAAPDLGIGAYRNATILNTVLGREVYPLPQRTAFTQFAPPTASLSQASVGEAPGGDRPRPALAGATEGMR